MKPMATVISDVPIFQQVGQTGTPGLWVIFALMLLSSTVFTYWASIVPIEKRSFHCITTFTTIIPAISYFALATGDGINLTEIIIKETHESLPDTIQHIFREVTWGRCIDWSLTDPLLLLKLGLLAGMDGASILISIVADIIMALLGLSTAYSTTPVQKWTYYFIAFVCYLVIVWQFVISRRRVGTPKDPKAAKLFNCLGWYTLLIWTVCPMIWAMSDGCRKWTVDTEVIVYGVFDILAKPVFGLWLLFSPSDVKSQSIGGWWSNSLSDEGVIRIDDDV